MNSPYQTVQLSSHDLAHLDASQLAWLPGWTRVLALLRSHTLLAALAILAVLGLLLAFHQVMLGAVAQGESLQQTRNQQSAAFWRCNALRSPTERDNCLIPVKAQVGAEAGS